jgi:cytoskeletal protein CcmA (bactofilin family)
MFGRKTNDNAISSMNAVNSIEKGTLITGDLNSEGNLRIDGNIKGTVTSKAKLVIGQTGFIEGDIKCLDAEIAGTVKGTMEVLDTLKLTSTANVIGDIKVGKLVIDAGAMYNGNCITNGGKTLRELKGNISEVKQIEE